MRRPGILVPAALSFVFLTCASQSSQRPSKPATGTPRTVRGPDAGWKIGWAKGAVFYEVCVRSFQDSDGDGKGDLPGLISRLDYLNDGDPATTTDLGIDGIWLMPVFRSPSYHGYDTTDYENVNPDYGTNEDLERLCVEAHRRGIRVIVDLVLNHSGSGHPWFQESASSPGSPKRDWYVWRDYDPGWKQPWAGPYGTSTTWHPLNGAYFYGVFWSGMPDLNYRSAEVRAEAKRIAGLWLSRGVDGFRLDASRYLIENDGPNGQQDTPETHAFWKEFTAHVRKVAPEALIVAENWTETPIIATYYGDTSVIPEGDELPMNFDFPLADQTLKGLQSGNATGIAATLDAVRKAYPATVTDTPFLTNHDQVRLITQLSGSVPRAKNAAALLLTYPGTPFLYYGEEVGLQNGTTNNDEAKRTPMPWDATAGGGFTTGSPWFTFAPGKESANVAGQTGNPDSLLSRYRTLIRARKGSVALTKGSLELLTPTSGSTPILAFLRVTGDERVLVAHNVSDGFAVGGPYAITGSTFEPLFTDANVGIPSGGSGRFQIALPARGTGIWRVR